MKDKSEYLNNHNQSASHTTSEDHNVKLLYIYIYIYIYIYMCVCVCLHIYTSIIKRLKPWACYKYVSVSVH